MNIRNILGRLLALVVLAAGLAAVTVLGSSTPAIACEPSTPSAAYARTLPQVRPGDKGVYVLGLQRNLKVRGSKIAVTGKYGDGTLRAVRSFQRRHGIKASGIVGVKTWMKLVGTIDRGSTAPQMVRHIPDFAVYPGSTNDTKLATLGNAMGRAHDYSVYGDAVGNGERYNAELVDLVKAFQRKAGIRDSGIVGPKTWTAYYRVISISGTWGC